MWVFFYDHRVDSTAVAFYFYQDAMAGHISSYRTNMSSSLQFSSVGTLKIGYEGLIVPLCRNFRSNV